MRATDQFFWLRASELEEEAAAAAEEERKEHCLSMQTANMGRTPNPAE